MTTIISLGSFQFEKFCASIYFCGEFELNYAFDMLSHYYRLGFLLLYSSIKIHSILLEKMYEQ